LPAGKEVLAFIEPNSS